MSYETSNNTCCFIGHRTINETEELKKQLSETVENLIVYKNINTFLFGSKSRFDSLCLEIVTKLKEKYPHIKRVYVRAEFRNIDKDYEDYLMKSYDKTYYPEKLSGAGRAVYVERNNEIIQKSRICIIYYDESYKVNKKSGTKTAYYYAVKNNKEIIRFPY